VKLTLQLLQAEYQNVNFLDSVSKEMVFKISWQGYGDLPSISTFRNGITFKRLMITGKEELS
jgi:hypothetical protein